MPTSLGTTNRELKKVTGSFEAIRNISHPDTPQALCYRANLISEGCTQTLNGFGDRGYYPHISAVPHISVHDITQSGKLLVASDGLLDLFHFDDLMMFIQNHNDNFEALLYTHIFETASNHVQYTTVTDTSTDVLYPTWDDVSAVVVSFV